MRLGVWTLVVALLFPAMAAAHEVRPAYLRIQALTDSQQPDRFDVLWRKPVGAGLPPDLTPELPRHCRVLDGPTTWVEGAVEVARWTVSCPGGIDGGRLKIAGLAATVADVLVRYERSDSTTQVIRMTPDKPESELSASETWLQVASAYFGLGVEHILLGIDHLLFVLALLMIVDGRRKLIATITSFTIAHSITLAAATLGFIHVPQKPVEAVIALSIVFVAMEIAHWREGRPGLTRRAPWVVAFVFGLLHGFGFAGALSGIGLPAHAIPSALLFFNVGVEAGQLIFVGAVLLVWSILRRVSWPSWGWHVPVYGIGAVAAFWTIERVASFAI